MVKVDSQVDQARQVGKYSLRQNSKLVVGKTTKNINYRHAGNNHGQSSVNYITNIVLDIGCFVLVNNWLGRALYIFVRDEYSVPF